MGVLLTVVIAVSILGILAGYLATKSKSEMGTAVLMIICIVAIMSNFVILGNADGFNINYNTTMNSSVDNITDVNTNITYTIPSEMDDTVDMLMQILAIVGFIVGFLIFAYVVIIKGIVQVLGIKL